MNDLAASVGGMLTLYMVGLTALFAITVISVEITHYLNEGRRHDDSRR